MQEKDAPSKPKSPRLTIVGGRPNERESRNAGIPRGVEVLLKKASIDPDFRQLLLEKRADAAGEIGLELNPAEKAMLTGIPQDQLETIISRTTIEPEQRRAFLGKAAVVMLGVLGLGTRGCEEEDDWPSTYGIQPR
jgi:hypothetical protein